MAGQSSAGDAREPKKRTLHQQHLGALQKRLAPYLREGFFFVNIGANDGVTADPIYPFVRRYGARGLFVEPVPYNFARLRENYADVPGLIYEQAVVSDEPRTFWYVEEGSESLPYVVSQMGTMDRDLLLLTIRNVRLRGDAIPMEPPLPEDLAEGSPEHTGVRISDDVEQYIRSIEVPCYTFDELLAKHGIERIDFLNTDVEGFDYELFKAIDFDRYKPGVYCVETIGFSEDEFADVRAQLSSRGYREVMRFGPHSHVFALDPPPAAVQST